jgi:hypothetical protein
VKIFDALLGVLPSWVPFAAVGVLVLGLVGGFVALKASWQAEGAARVIAADRKAVIEQQQKDARLSAELVNRQAAEIAVLQDKAQTVITRIDHAPKTTGCGPVMRDASRGMRELFNGAGGTPAGRRPAAALPGPGAGR